MRKNYQFQAGHLERNYSFKSGLFGGTYKYICLTMSIVPPLVLWFEMWGARDDNIRMLRKFCDLG